jgi:hypothetical protein
VADLFQLRASSNAAPERVVTGIDMSRSLRLEDRQAVDMLMDKSRSPVGFTAETNLDPARLNAVSAVLHLLDALPADEPSADLLTRTMSRIDARQPAAAAAMPDSLRAALGGTQAHA